MLAVFGLVSLTAAAAPESARPLGLPGTTEHRIKEPVFKGQAVVYETGQEHARTILLVHGLGNNGASDYRDQIDWLARSYHVLAVDLPGFAQSDKANLMYTPANYVDFLKHVADRFAHKPFTLVGHSMGGVVVLRYASTFVDDIDRLVVVDAPGILHRYAFSSHLLTHLGIDFLPAMMDPLPKLANLARRLLGRIERSTLDPETVLNNGTLRTTVLGGDPGKIAGLAVAIEDISQYVTKLRAPTLVIWGKEDSLAPPRTGRVLAQLLSPAWLAVIEHAAHVPMEENPERFRAVLEPFLNNGVAPTSVATPPLKKNGDTRCSSKKNVVYEGEFERLSLSDCKDAHIRHARIRELQLNNSSVRIEDSEIGGGGETGLYAIESVVEMTNVRIVADVAIFASSSRFDFAGGEIDAKQAVMQVRSGSTIAFSLSRVRSPSLNGLVHYFYGVTEEKPI